jgi:hypothetical protein
MSTLKVKLATAALAALLAGGFAVPQEAFAQAANPCAPKTTKAANPCAAKPTNPCAPKAANPCAAKPANPCAPKAANPCAPKK